MLLIDAAEQSERETGMTDGASPHSPEDNGPPQGSRFAVVMMFAAAVPLLVAGLAGAKQMRSAQVELSELLSAQTATFAEISAATDQVHSGARQMIWAFIAATICVCVAALIRARRAGGLEASRVRAMASFTLAAAAGDLGARLARGDDSDTGDLEEALALMVARFSGTIDQIDHAAANLKGASAQMAETSDEAGRAIGEVAQSISSISGGAGQGVALATRTSDFVAKIESAIRTAAAT